MSLIIIEAIDTNERNQCLEIRRQVFIEGQGVDESIEMDSYDKTALFLLASLDSVPVGTCRLKVNDKDKTVKLERVAVLEPYRGQGIGKQLTLKANKMIEHQYKHYTAKMHAQEQVVSFYELLGWSVCSEKFLEANIWHFAMHKVV